MNRVFLYIVSLLFVSLLCEAKNFHQIPGYKGSVYGIFQTNDHYVWFGTENGLARYDGDSFKWFTHSTTDSSSISSNETQCFYQDKQNRFWVGTKNGLNLMDLELGTFKSFLPSNSSISHHRIRHIVPQNDSILWVSTYGGGVNVFNTQTEEFKPLAFLTELNCQNINHLFKDKTGFLWIGSEKNGLIRYNPTTQNFTHFHPKNTSTLGFDDIATACIAQAPSGEIWVGTWNKGLYKYNATHNTFTHVSYSSYFDMESIKGQKTIRDINFDIDGNLWLGTNSSLVLWNPKTQAQNTYHHIKYDQRSLPQGRMWDFYTDQTGILWIGYLHGGVCKYDPFENIIEPVYFKNEGVDTRIDEYTTTNFVDSEKNYWVGTYDGSLKRYNLTTREEIPVPTLQLKAGEIVYQVTEDRHQLIWIATSIGIHVFNLKTEQTHFYSKELFEEQTTHIWSAGFYTVVFDSNDHVFLGGWNTGLITVNRKGIKNTTIDFNEVNSYTTSNSNLPDNKIWRLYVDDKDYVWIATGNGFIKYSPTHQSLTQLDVAKDVFAIHETQNGALIRGRSSGTIEVLKNNTWETLYQLPASELRVTSFHETDLYLWVGTSKGLFKIETTSKSIKQFGTSHGLRNLSLGLSNPVQWKEQLFYVTNNGLSSIHTAPSLTNAHQPVPQLSSFQFTSNDGTEKITPPLSELKDIPYSTNRLTISFVALSYSKPNETSYSFQLKGLESKWQSPENNQRSVNYSNLPPGNYSFLLKASNADGLWSEPKELLQFVILPPWWQTWWAYVLHAVCFLVLVYFVNSFSLIKVKAKNQLLLEKTLRLKDEEVNRAKLDFFTNISHDLRTPLTLILGPIKRLLSLDDLKEHHKQPLETVERNTDHLLSLVNELLDFRKVTSKNSELYTSTTNLSSFFDDLFINYKELALLKNISLLHQEENIEIVIWDPEKMKKVFHNLIGNAFKYAPENSTLQISSKLENDKLLITVSDEGPGIPAELRDNLFTPFVSGKKGTGIGLSLVKEIITLHSGTIKLTNLEQKGTSFLISIPQKENSEIVAPSTSPKDQQNEKPQLLVIEDNKEIAVYIESLLSEHYTVFVTHNGADGLQVAKEEPIDLILSDVMMPVMDGFELCEAIKTNIITSHIPFLLLTARYATDFEIKGLSVSADDYITKPFNEEVLLLKIANTLASRKEQYHKLSLTAYSKKETKNTLSLDEELMKNLLHLIQENISNPDLNVEWLSHEIGMNRSHLSRKIKTISGNTTKDYIKFARLNHAKHLLETSSLTVSEVAYETGFNNPKYFSTAFKDFFGKSPSDFVS